MGLLVLLLSSERNARMRDGWVPVGLGVLGWSVVLGWVDGGFGLG